MANYFQFADTLTPNEYVSSTSRYLGSAVVYYGQQKKITFNIYKRQPVPENEQDKFMVITAGYEYRPDLVSYKSYGTSDYWWLILQANNINDVYQFRTGLNIRIPYTISQF
jgi:hypothetical protein